MKMIKKNKKKKREENLWHPQNRAKTFFCSFLNVYNAALQKKIVFDCFFGSWLAYSKCQYILIAKRHVIFDSATLTKLLHSYRIVIQSLKIRLFSVCERNSPTTIMLI